MTNKEEVCTTKEAARLLGMSVSTVQALVETAALSAWKTKGGHRRIPLKEVLAYKASLKESRQEDAQLSSELKVLVLEDEEMQRKLYEIQFESWDMPLSVTYCRTGYEALLEIGANPPDVFIADIKMNGIDGYEVIETILARPSLRHINIIIASSIGPEEIQNRGGVPKDLEYFSKPVVFEELRGYLRACYTQKLKRMK